MSLPQHDWSVRDIASADDIRAIERQPYGQVIPFRSTFDLIRHSAARVPDKAALIFQVDADVNGEILKWSYSGLLEQIVRAANLFRQCGIGRGDPVAILAPNIPSTHVALWGAQLAGCVFPINYLLGAEHISKLLQAAQVRVVVTLAHSEELDIRQTVGQAVEASGLDCRILEIDANEAEPAEGSFQSMLGQADPIDRLSQELRPEDVAAIFHTGGTTGLPKILRQTHANELHTSCLAPAYYRFHEGDVLLNGFPLFHVAGAFVYGLAALAARGAIYIPTTLGMRNRQFVHNAWKLFSRHRVSHLGCVPTTLASLAQSHRDTNAQGNCGVRAALTGGSPLPPELAAQFELRTQIPVRNIFGMTECAGIVSIEPSDAPRTAGSAGLALPYTQVRAVPLSEASKAVIQDFCEAGAEGVLCVRGPHVSPGYMDASRNAGTFTQNGWLVSGDLGYVDAQGRIYITGRSKDLIIRGGHNIDPQAIEEAFLADPDVLGCAAVGQPDEYAGELPVVFIALKPGAAATAQELLAKARSRISEPPAVPKAVYLVEALPVTPVGKIFKPDLRRMAILEKIRSIASRYGQADACRARFPDKDAMQCVVSIRKSGGESEVSEALKKLPIDIVFEESAP